MRCEIDAYTCSWITIMIQSPPSVVCLTSHTTRKGRSHMMVLAGVQICPQFANRTRKFANSSSSQSHFLCFSHSLQTDLSVCKLASPNAWFANSKTALRGLQTGS